MKIAILSMAILYSSFLEGQNRTKADSLLQLLNEGVYSDSLTFEIEYRLAFYHPIPVNSMKHAKRAVEISKDMQNDLNQARALEAIGRSNRLLGNNPESFLATYEALQIYERLGLMSRKASLLSQIASNHVIDENFDEAIDNFRRSKNPFELLSDDYRLATTLVNLGETYRLSGKLDSAEYSFRNALELNKSLDHDVIEAYSLGNLGMTHHAQGDLSIALTELNRSVEILSELGDPASLVIYDAEIGQIQIKQGFKSDGFERIERAFLLAKSEHLKEQVRDLSKTLSELYVLDSKFEEAFSYQREFKIYSDSLVNAGNIRLIEQTKAKYEMDKQMVRSDSLLKQRQTEIRYTVLTIALLILIICVVFYAYQNKRRLNLELNTKNRIIKAQVAERELLHREMHHRVKNNLQLISSIMGLHAQEAEDQNVSIAISEGKSRMGAMSLIHQKLYGKEEVSYINLKSYLEGLIDNLRFTFSGQVEKIDFNSPELKVSADDSIPIGLIVNEAICNAVKHSQKNDLLIHISLKSTENGYFSLIIEDNGIENDNHEISAGFGTMLISTLAKQLNAKLEIINSASGTAIRLHFLKFRLASSNPILNGIAV